MWIAFSGMICELENVLVLEHTGILSVWYPKILRGAITLFYGKDRKTLCRIRRSPGTPKKYYVALGAAWELGARMFCW